MQKRYLPSGPPEISDAGPVRINLPEPLLSGELELLYTGRGLGEALDYLFYKGRDGNTDIEGNLTDKLRKDFLSLWRSHLHSDIRIVIIVASDAASGQEPQAAIFRSHRFILASRSSYFRQQLRQVERVSGELTLTLPSPPFTLLSLYLTLGWIYAGTLAFSDQHWNLATAFEIMRCATYLCLDALYDEIQARIVMDMMHGLFHPFLLFSEYESITGGAWGAVGCKCRQCTRRAPRVLEFALEDEVKNAYLERGARRALIAYFGEGWCTPEFAHLLPKTRLSILKELTKCIIPLNIFPLLYASQAGMKKLEGVGELWAAVSREMLVAAVGKIDKVLCDQSAECFRQKEWLDIVDTANDGNAERDEKLKWITNAVQRGINDSNAAKLYQVCDERFPLSPTAQRLSGAKTVNTIPPSCKLVRPNAR
ncbi:uncharacterized protein PHACADRAFT_265227 [Phanerochaete carnosa HHB-10118-sp]|uniref:BTB domain-containing protein n=1 Tax=Phanerochaete carnosa (strain HHB-10118-sp) TaxID=650164 RepID=K5VSV6_PHACS|nr:uncharacterized protein PHACADRAFT_265227 [Phanerochaete carnosa HHB-10118-sp]EKM49659.1 hypothetical protein PHACADRAFT_265227 [Phanerochaete carnosa HHB-10118-sp]